MCVYMCMYLYLYSYTKLRGIKTQAKNNYQIPYRGHVTSNFYSNIISRGQFGSAYQI